MSVRVYVDGEGAIKGATPEQLDVIRNITDYYGIPVFNVDCSM